MILVFGKNGQVGRELGNFDEVLVLGRDTVDLTDPLSCGDIIQKHRPKAVINAAAYTNVDRAEDEQSLALTINGNAPGQMASSCKELGIPFIHISSDYVFAGNGKKPWTTSCYTSPKNSYGHSKVFGEKAIRKVDGIYTILRTSWVFSSTAKNFLRTMLQLSETNQILKIVKDQVGGPTPAKEIAKACHSIANQLLIDPGKSGTYHFSGYPDVTWYSFADYIFNKSNRKVKLHPVFSDEFTTKAKRPLNSRLDCSKTFETFNLSRPNWRDGVNEILVDLEII